MGSAQEAFVRALLSEKKIEERHVQDRKGANFGELFQVSGIFKENTSSRWAFGQCLKRRAETDLDHRSRYMTAFGESFGRSRGLDGLLSACTENDLA